MIQQRFFFHLKYVLKFYFSISINIHIRTLVVLVRWLINFSFKSNFLFIVCIIYIYIYTITGLQNEIKTTFFENNNNKILYDDLTLRLDYVKLERKYPNINNDKWKTNNNMMSHCTVTAGTDYPSRTTCVHPLFLFEFVY